MKQRMLKRKNNTNGKRRQNGSKMMKGTLARHLTLQLGQVSLLSYTNQSSSSTSFFPDPYPPNSLPTPADDIVDDKDFILSQDFFCTPDYITPDAQNLPNDHNKENTCPKSPDKFNTVKNKRYKHDMLVSSPSSTLCDAEQVMEIAKNILEEDEEDVERTVVKTAKNKSYVSQSAVALRCRVLPPPCIQNPYLKDASEMDVDPFSDRRAKCAGLFPALIGADGLSRYRTDFHEIEQIGTGNFSRVFKVLNRIDGCMYAVKRSTRPLYQDTERRKALMEVQALAALGTHENIVGYYSSWFENEQLYIQMELCDHSLSITSSSQKLNEGDVLEAMRQVANALQFIHERGIAHLDVKLENIYVKNGIYKLGDFGCATRLDNSLPVEEGDARYAPQEILNDKYDFLDKADIFSLGASMYELLRGSPLPESGPMLLNLKEGRLPLLPGHSLHLQNLLKSMVDPDPICRPSAKDLVENSILAKLQRNTKTK